MANQDQKEMQMDTESNYGFTSVSMLSLSKDEVRCVRALKKMQVKYTEINAEFHKELHLLECKYSKLYEDFFQKRSAIVNGNYKPTDEECAFDAGEVTDDAESKEKNFDNGIEDFWLNVMVNSSLLNEYINDYDKPILKHLKDIQLVMFDDPMSFQLKFVFEPNEFFTNEVLTKTYFLKIEVLEAQPNAFQGIEFDRCESSVINWNEGKNPAITVVKKKQKHKTRGIVRTLMKTLERSSFFNFFRTITDSEDLPDSERYMLHCDYDLGNYIKDRIIPYATDYFTGEMSDDEDDDEDDEEEEEEGEDEDEDEKEIEDGADDCGKCSDSDVNNVDKKANVPECTQQ